MVRTPARVPTLVLAALTLGVVAPAAVWAGALDLTVSGNEVSGTIDLAGGLGADLDLRFEQVVGLTVANLGAAVQSIDPLDLSLAGRLPSGVAIPAAFPVRLVVEPPASGGLSFSGVYTLALHTHNLEFTAGCPLRLFKASGGGTFEDITDSIGMGSYRAGATGGGFSEFLIVADTRPIASVVAAKFDAVEDLLATHGGVISAAVVDDLADLILGARAYYQAGEVVQAAQTVDAFVALVKAQSGTAIPDVWRASRDLVDVAGLLRAAGATLRFSLNLASAG